MHPVGVSLPYPLWLRLALGATRPLLQTPPFNRGTKGKVIVRVPSRATGSHFVSFKSQACLGSKPQSHLRGGFCFLSSLEISEKFNGIGMQGGILANLNVRFACSSFVLRQFFFIFFFYLNVIRTFFWSIRNHEASFFCPIRNCRSFYFIFIIKNSI